MKNQQDIAKFIGTSQSFVSMFFNGQCGCKYSTAQKLGEYFKKPAHWFMEASTEQKQALLKNGNGQNLNSGCGRINEG